MRALRKFARCVTMLTGTVVAVSRKTNLTIRYSRAGNDVVVVVVVVTTKRNTA